MAAVGPVCATGWLALRLLLPFAGLSLAFLLNTDTSIRSRAEFEEMEIITFWRNSQTPLD